MNLVRGRCCPSRSVTSTLLRPFVLRLPSSAPPLSPLAPPPSSAIRSTPCDPSQPPACTRGPPACTPPAASCFPLSSVFLLSRPPLASPSPATCATSSEIAAPPLALPSSLCDRCAAPRAPSSSPLIAGSLDPDRSHPLTRSITDLDRPRWSPCASAGPGPVPVPFKLKMAE
eukprot:3334608-Rhodomonas_salina.1